MVLSILRKKSFWLLVGCGIVLALGGRYITILFNPPALLDWLDTLGPWQVPVFLGIHIITNVLGIPASLLVVVGGIRFGLWWGSLWSLLGATAGAIAAFWLARYLLQDWFRHRFQRHSLLSQIDRLMDTHAINCVLAVRFSPLSPFNLVNFLFGLTSVPVTTYALGTFIGITPGTIAYTWLGMAGLDAIAGRGLWQLGLALGFLTLLSLLPLWLQRQHRIP
ncbi:TVP38/TMEM64 family protein [Leptolyngbya sp. PCC 6406]|uniref:TVP38/TMEM64 family protein n=1 Tax=Leptolyngbya sp. PCC 6406 TaxID=1173264 RepID=UPI0002AC55C4|nr:TVP38/TMEM64 family protein [Leptolyngbya sp. PCC 6406]